MTSSQVPKRSHRSIVVSVGLFVALVVAALVFSEPLIAWFTGKSMGGGGAQVAAQAGPFSLKASLDPDPPQEKGNALVLEIHDASGKPVDDATIEVIYDMPAMATMAEMKGSGKITHEKGGRYRAEFDLPMGGTWPINVSIKAPAGWASQTFKLTVGGRGLSSAGGAAAAKPSTSGTGAPAAGSPEQIDHYTCSMHPSVKQQGPGKCPICGMDLIPVTKEQEQGVVMIDEGRRQLIGVRTGRVVEGPMRESFRAVGRVAYDESTLTDVNLKVRGWITKLFVSRTGQRVAKGQALFTMYSPELYNAQQDFLLSLHGASALATTSVDEATIRGESLGRAARQRLRLLGLDDAQIDAAAKTGTPMESISVPSPASGFVIEKDVVEGASVEAGMRLFRIAALNRVWVEADVYEADLARVRVGQTVKVTLDYLPGRTYDAKVAYVYPYLDSKARTGRVRVEIANKELDLRPGMYASVELGADVGSRVQVPASAVVYTGPRRLVFIDLGEGRFKPQEIEVGAEANGMFAVLSGLKAGDLVATSGVFLIAAEARISTAATYWESSTESVDGGMAAASDAATLAPTASAMPSMPGMRDMPSMPMPKSTRTSTPAAMPNVQPTSNSSTGAVPPPAAPNAPTPTVYSCPMHPEVRSGTPGKCPKCGMDLQPMGGTP